MPSIIFTVSAYACTRKNSCSPLPCPTAVGKNIVSCLVNGKPFVAEGGKPGDNSLICNEGNEITTSGLGGPNFFFDVSFCLDRTSKSGNRSMTIYINDSMKIKTYKLNTQNYVYTEGWLFNGATNDALGGELKITTLTDNLVAGDFSFKEFATDPTIGILNITQGHFDLAR